MGPRIKSEVIYKGPDKTPEEYFDKFATVFEKEAMVNATETSIRAAEWIRDEARKVLDNQEYAWKDLNDKYLKKKEREGLDLRTLIATGLYRRSIRVWYTPGKGKNKYVHVGIRPGAVYPRKTKRFKGGIPVEYVARVHEFGTDNIPARPLWRPILSRAVREQGRFRRQYYAAVKRAVRQKFARKTLTRRM